MSTLKMAVPEVGRGLPYAESRLEPPSLPRRRRLLASALLGFGLVFGLSTAPALAMEIDDIFALLSAGVTEETIAAQLDAEDARIELRTQDILALKRAGASEALIRRIIRGREESNTIVSSPEDPYSGYGESACGGVVLDIRSDVYDPFGYMWCWQPYAFTYYYPFRWWDTGFYCGGWYDYNWCGWSPRVSHYWDYYHWDRPRDHARGGRNGWERNPRNGGGRNETVRDNRVYGSERYRDQTTPTRRGERTRRDGSSVAETPATPPPPPTDSGRGPAWGRSEPPPRRSEPSSAPATRRTRDAGGSGAPAAPAPPAGRTGDRGRTGGSRTDAGRR